MLPQLAAAFIVWALLCAVAFAVGVGFGKRGEPLRDWLSMRLRHHGDQTPKARPIEAIAADLNRLGARFHGLDPRASYAKSEAVRGAYDRALSECCAALELTELLGVLAPGPELDAERERVEAQLTHSGVRLPHAA